MRECELLVFEEDEELEEEEKEKASASVSERRSITPSYNIERRICAISSVLHVTVKKPPSRTNLATSSAVAFLCTLKHRIHVSYRALINSKSNSPLEEYQAPPISGCVFACLGMYICAGCARVCG